MKPLASIIIGSTNAMTDMSPYFTELKVMVAKRLDTLLGGKLETQYGRGNIEFEAYIDVSLPYSKDDPDRIKKDGTTIPVKPAEIRFNLSFSVPDSSDVKEEDYTDGFHSKDISRVVYTEVVPDDVIKDLGKFKKFFEEKLFKGIDATINNIKDELEAPLKEQAIFALNSLQERKGEELQKIIKDVKSMSLQEVLDKKGILKDLPRMLFPMMSINLEVRPSGNKSYKIEDVVSAVPADTKKEQAAPEKGKNPVKLEEAPSRIETELEEKEKKKALEESRLKEGEKQPSVRLEEQPSGAQTELEKTAIESEKPKEEKKESPIPPPIESKTVIEKNTEKTSEYSNTTKETPALFQSGPFDATLQKEAATSQEKTPEKQEISDNDIFTLQMFSLFEAAQKDQEAIKKEKEKEQAAEKTKQAANTPSAKEGQTTYEKTNETTTESTYRSSETGGSNEVFNSQVLGQTVLQTIILSGINDSISSLNNNLESYMKVSEKTSSIQGGVFDSLKDIISSKESTKETSTVIKDAAPIVEMAGLISPERMESLEKMTSPKLETYEQKNSYSAIEKSVSNMETNNISSTDITKLGEDFNNSIKTVITNPSTVNNNIKEPSVSPVSAAPSASPKPPDASLMQDNSSMQNNMGSSNMPSTVSLSNTTVDNIANAIVKALTLTPFLNNGK